MIETSTTGHAECINQRLVVESPGRRLLGLFGARTTPSDIHHPGILSSFQLHSRCLDRSMKQAWPITTYQVCLRLLALLKRSHCNRNLANIFVCFATPQHPLETVRLLTRPYTWRVTVTVSLPERTCIHILAPASNITCGTDRHAKLKPPTSELPISSHTKILQRPRPL